MTAAVPDCGYCRWVLWGTAGTVQYPQYPLVLQGTVGTVGTARGDSDSWVLRQYPWVLQGTVGTVGTVTVGYCGYCRWVLGVLHVGTAGYYGHTQQKEWAGLGLDLGLHTIPYTISNVSKSYFNKNGEGLRRGRNNLSTNGS